MQQVAADALPAGLVALDARDRILSVNSVVAGWAETTAQQLIGEPIERLLHQPHIDGTEEYLPSVADIVRADGSRLPVFVVEGERSAEGELLVTLFDATRQRDFRNRLLERHSLIERTQTRLELVIASSIAFAATRDETELAEVLVDTANRAYNAEQSCVFLLDDDMLFRQVAGGNAFVELPESDRLAVEAIALREVLKISGVEAAYKVDPVVGRAFEATGVQSLIVAPIRQLDESLGILVVFFHHPRTFDEQASPLADALAGQAARAMLNLRLQHRLEHAALHDDTTGLPNRRFLEETTEMLPRTKGTVVAALFVDLDGFKAVNDQLGHHVGDELLRIVGQRIQAVIRESDIAVRYGGDEFVIVCETADERSASELAERIRDTIRAPYSFLPAQLNIGASIGVSVSPATEGPLLTDVLVRSADQAMYRAKGAGGDRIEASTADQPREAP